ncbi:MAG: sigma-E factor negative regulatory protein [Proteobacteria bacterium]|nr:sigma-E factor negative regulatory protein [Pseudomonadota bacterium]MCP4917533.1 sigma-E factor negative regulatory protein [Pseudomonadota bacterium]
MNEFFARERLSAYIDGELSASEMTEVDQALQRSAELREEYEQLVSAVRFVNDHGTLQAPPDFHKKVLAAVEDEPMPGGFWLRVKAFFTPVPMESLAVAVAAVLVAVLVGRNMNDDVVVPEDAPPEISAAADPEPEEDVALIENEVVEDGLADADIATTNEKKANPPAWAQEMAKTLGPLEETSKDDRIAGATLSDPEDGVVKLEMPPPSPDAAERAEPEISEPELKASLKASQSMQLHVTDSGALRDLLNIVNRYGGTAVDSKGKTVDEDALDTTSRVGIQILLPQESVTSFTMALQQIGSVTGTTQNEAGLYTADQKIGLYVEVVSSP